MDTNNNSFRNFKIDEELTNDFFKKPSDESDSQDRDMNPGNKGAERKQSPIAARHDDKSNTLDYYNDDLSRKAVGRLVDNMEKEEFVSGYDKENDKYVKAGTRDEEIRREPKKEYKKEYREEYQEEYREEHKKGYKKERNNDDDGFVISSVNNKNRGTASRNTQTKAKLDGFADDVLSSVDSGNEDEYEYSLFRRDKKMQKPNQKINPAASQYTDNRKVSPYRQPEKQNDRQTERQAFGNTGERKVVKAKPLPSYEFTGKEERDIDVNDRERNVKDRKGEPMNNNPNRGSYKSPSTYSTQRTSQKRSMNLDDDSAYGDGKQISFIRIAAVAAISVFLIISIALVMKVNAMNKELKAAKATIAQNTTLAADNLELKLNNTDYSNEIKKLQDEIAELKAANPEVPTDPVPNPGTTGTSPAASGTQAGLTTDASGVRKYTVKSGDTFTKISKEVYGSAARADYMKIMEKNGFTEATAGSLKLGQVLIIP